MINKDTYKRLTNKKGNYTTVSGSKCPKETKRGYFCDKENCKLRITRECPFLKSFDRLAELEDKIMDGTLMELPFLIKVSSKYAVIVDRDKDGRIYKTHTYNIAEAEARLKELQEKK